MMAEACTGVPLPVLREMVRPKGGLLGKSRWLPSVSDVADWIDGYQRKFKVTTGEPLTPVQKEKFYDRNGRLISGKTFSEPLTKAEREAHADKLTALARTIRSTAKATQRASRGWEKGLQQVHDGDALMKALNILEISPSSQRTEQD